jgi:hypothetical protein
MSGNRRFIPEDIRGSATAEGLISTQAGGEFRYIIKLGECDRIRCTLDDLEIRPSHSERISVEPQGLQKTLMYLEGGLVVTENGGTEKKLVLRSATPRMVGTKIAFFEIVVDPDAGITVGQVLYDRVTGERSRAPAAMSRDVLERLANDLTDLL